MTNHQKIGHGIELINSANNCIQYSISLARLDPKQHGPEAVRSIIQSCATIDQGIAQLREATGWPPIETP